MTMNVNKLCLLLLLLLVVSSCKNVKHAPPQFTICTYLSTGKLFCADNTKDPKGEKIGNERDINQSDIVMSPEGFKDLYNYGFNLRKQLLNCEGGRR